MRTATAKLTVKALVDCPHCGEEADLMDVDRLANNDWVLERLLVKRLEFDEDIQCIHCLFTFNVNEMEY